MFAEFKRSRAKLVGARLHLGNRRYEAPALSKDHELWKAEDLKPLSDVELDALEDIRRRDAPMSPVIEIDYSPTSISTAFTFIRDVCSQSLTKIALDETERFPEMLLWLKQGEQFHRQKNLESCLLCGSPLTNQRKEALAAAFDSHVDEFIALLTKTDGRLRSMVDQVARLHEMVPHSEAVSPELRDAYAQCRRELIERVSLAKDHLETLNNALASKRERPATPADMSLVTPQEDVDANIQALDKLFQALNEQIRRHNQTVREFAKHRDDAETSIRKHFTAESREEFAANEAALQKAESVRKSLEENLSELSRDATKLRQQIRAHGPAAGVINQLVSSYLGHAELTVQPVEIGYELHRHGSLIQGMPSEGEKTAIALAYFISSLQSDGQKLKDLIIVVDDPVSSLDTKALNFACSLVRNRLNDSAQVFVLTHNLHCMNEFRKYWKSLANPKNGDPTATLLYIRKLPRQGDSSNPELLAA